MAFAYTSALQNRIALAVWGVQNSSLNATQKVQLDLTWTTGALAGGAAYDAYIEVSQLAQYFEQAASTPDLSFPEPAWDRLFVACAGMLLNKTVRPDNYPRFKADYETALDQTIDTYTRVLISTTSLDGQGIDLAGIRAFVVDHCVKRANSATGLRRRLFPSIAQIDGHLQWTLNYVWNKTPWHFRKRQVTMTVTVATVASGTWVESTKTLTSASSFANTAVGAGDRILITAGSKAVQGEYVVATRVSADAVTLVSSLSSDGSDLATGDIAGKVQTVSLTGMASGETFDAVMSRKFFYDGSFYGNELQWADSTDLARRKACNLAVASMPAWFRWEKAAAVLTWHLAPFPDTSYTLRGAVSVTGPGTLSTAASLVTAIARFPAEFGTVIRDMTLARTLQQFGASDGEAMMKAAHDQCDFLLPIYSDQGFPTRQTSVGDVYEDYSAMTGRTWPGIRGVY